MPRPAAFVGVPAGDRRRRGTSNVQGGVLGTNVAG